MRFIRDGTVPVRTMMVISGQRISERKLYSERLVCSRESESDMFDRSARKAEINQVEKKSVKVSDDSLHQEQGRQHDSRCCLYHVCLCGVFFVFFLIFSKDWLPPVRRWAVTRVSVQMMLLDLSLRF